MEENVAGISAAAVLLNGHKAETVSLIPSKQSLKLPRHPLAASIVSQAEVPLYLAGTKAEAEGGQAGGLL